MSATTWRGHQAQQRAWRRDQSIPYGVSAWAASNGLVLGQWKVADKSNEITALPELLRVLELAGCIVTVDAMGCQKKIAQEIIESDADYVLALKGNHETVYEEVKTFLDALVAERSAPRPVSAKLSKAAATLASVKTVEKDHGRIETRRYDQSAQLDWFADRGEWEGLRTVGVVEATREMGEQRTVERRYYLDSSGVTWTVRQNRLSRCPLSAVRSASHAPTRRSPPMAAWWPTAPSSRSSAGSPIWPAAFPAHAPVPTPCPRRTCCSASN